MTDETNVASTTETAPQLKSTDTRVQAVTEPAQPEVTEKPAQEAPEGGSDASAADSSRKKQKLPRWMKERLERAKQVTALETEARIRKELQTEAAPPKQEQEAKTSGKTLADFDYDQDAYFDYKVEEKLKARDEKATKAKQDEERAQSEKTFKAKVDEFEKRVGDGAWEEIEQSPLNLDKSYAKLAEMIQGEDAFLDIAHHLAMNHDEAAEIAKLPPLKMALAVAKIAERFEDKPEEKKVTNLPKKVTNAPPPPKTVSGAGKPSVDIRAPEMSTEERIAAWRKR